MVLRVNFNVVISGEDIDDIMCSALEGGINYWCGKAEVDGKYLGTQLSAGRPEDKMMFPLRLSATEKTNFLVLRYYAFTGYEK